MVLSKDLLYPALSITSSFDFFSVNVILIIRLMYHIFSASTNCSSLLSNFFVGVQHSHPYKPMDHNYVGFHSFDLGINSDVSIGEDGF